MQQNFCYITWEANNAHKQVYFKFIGNLENCPKQIPEFNCRENEKVKNVVSVLLVAKTESGMVSHR